MKYDWVDLFEISTLIKKEIKENNSSIEKIGKCNLTEGIKIENERLKKLLEKTEKIMEEKNK